MAAQLTIIGLGQIGASAGLALAKHADKITRVGHDREPTVARRAQGMGAVDRIVHNLPAAVEEAGFVLLALPFDQVRDTLKVIGPCLQEKTVVMDTSPLKSIVAGWMKEYLPDHCYYIGLTPAVNSIYLENQAIGLDAAHSDLFSYGMLGISAPPDTPGEAVKLAADFATLLDSKPYFIDLAEADGIMSALHLLPQVTASALVNMVTQRSGWTDARRLAGRPFVGGTQPVLTGDQGKALAQASLQGHANLFPVLDEFIAKLQDLKETISAGEQKKVEAWFENARAGRTQWLRERSSGDWLAIDHKVVDIPKQSIGKRLFGNLGKWFGSPKPPPSDENK